MINAGDSEAAPQAALALGVMLAAYGRDTDAAALLKRVTDSGHPVHAPAAEEELRALTDR